MYKLMAGIYFGGIATAAGRAARDEYGFPLKKVIDALSSGTLAAFAGLVVTHNIGLVQATQIAVAPIIDLTKNENIGVCVQFDPLRLEVTVTPPPLSASKIANWHRFAGRAS